MDIISALEAMQAGAADAATRDALRLLGRGPACLALLAGDTFECMYANGAFARLARRGPPVGHAFFDFFPELEEQGARVLFERVAALRRPWVGRSRQIGLSRAGVLEWHVFDVALQAIRGVNGERSGILVHCYNARDRHPHGTDQVQGRDRVTGLADYDAFRAVLGQVLAALPDGMGGTAAILDISNFHRVNACIGHDGGDRILRAVGIRLRVAAGPGTLVARAGANRFLLLFGWCGDKASSSPAEVMAAFDAPFNDSGLPLYLTARAGKVRFPEHGADAGQVMASLDQVLSEARQAAPGVMREGAYVEGRAREQTRLAVALRDAIDRGGIEVHYQPQVNLESGAICGVEALVRWTDPVAGPVPADEIVRLAEETGLIGRLGERVLRLACAQAQFWRDMGFFDLRVAVNLSARQVCMQSLERMVLDALEHTGLPPANLDLELTESVVMDDMTAAAACLERLKGHGVQLSLDDFGTGYSSLAYLRLFPIDRLKIDRLFLDLVPENARAVSLVSAIIGAAHGLGMRVVAEGVEHEAQLAFLAREGCDEIQGYFFSKPLTPAQATSMLTQRRMLPAALRCGGVCDV